MHQDCPIFYCGLYGADTLPNRYLEKYITQSVLVSKKSTSTRALVEGTKQDRQAWAIDVLTLTAYIFSAATKKTNIHNKTGNT